MISVIILRSDPLREGEVEDLRSHIGDFFDDREKIVDFAIVENVLE